MIKHFYPVLLVAALLTTACTNNQDDVTEVTDPSNKTAISFVGQDNSRLGTRYGFEGSADSYTQIAMHIRSNESGTSSVRETSTLVKAEHDATKTKESVSEIKSLGDSYTRYWDDAFGRKAQLSVFAIAVPGKSSPSNASETLENKLGKVEGEKAWGDKALSEVVSWTVSSDQSGTNTIDNEDLVYSNNIKGEAKLKFTPNDTQNPDGPGKFDQGNLKFNHALSRITVNLKKGNGFTGDNSFKFANGTNVKILNVPVSGTLDLSSGSWTSSDETGISKMAETAKDATFKPDYAFLAQVIPVFTISSTSTKNVLSFVIDNNQYYVTQAQMFEALKDNSKISTDKKTETSISLENGRNYVFNITVSKTQITNVNATIVDWIDVESTLGIDNSHYSFSLYNQGTLVTAENSFKFYRYQDATINSIKTDASDSKAWFGNYTASTGLTYNSSEKRWETEWYFDDNTKYYHFRTTSNDNITSSNYHSDATNGDYFTMTSGAISAEVGKGTDYLWGAPFVSTTSPIPYSTTDGYTESLSPAIGATNSAINMTELHMMSNIKIVLKTTAQPAATNNAVVLYDANASKGSTVALTNFYTKGNVSMGSGKVTPTTLNSDATGVQITSPSPFYKTDYTETNAFSYSVIPQPLVENTRKVGLIITTPDNNQYVIADLSQIAFSSTDNSLNKNNSKYWYPGHQYIYTINLTKTGITHIQCSVVDWITVTAENQNISLEN